MSVGNLLDQIHEEISGKVGLPTESLPILIYYCSHKVRVRLPEPGDDRFDMRPDDETTDIVGEGQTLEEAIENVVSSHRKAVSQKVKFFWFGRERTLQ